MSAPSNGQVLIPPVTVLLVLLAMWFLPLPVWSIPLALMIVWGMTVWSFVMWRRSRT